MTREEAIEWFKQNPFNHDGHEPFAMAIEALKAEPIKHGKWVEASDGSGYVGEPCEACSVCGMQTDYPSNYCPNCGARMEGEEDG